MVNILVIRVGAYISASEHYRKLKLRTYCIPSSDTNKQNLFILSHLSDFVACSTIIILYLEYGDLYLMFGT